MTPIPSRTGANLGRLRGAARSVLARLRASPEGEHEMALNRVVAGFLLVSYFIVADPWGDVFALASAYAVGGALFIAHVLWRPTRAARRQRLARVFDLGLLSVSVYVGGEATAILYPLYLWIIFGNGFRFGVSALLESAAISVVGFALALGFTPYWRTNFDLGLGLLGCLIVLPAYASTLIKKLSRAKLAAEEANRAKSLFLASVSHELRTPLNAVIGMTDLLEGTELDGEQRDMARTAGDAGRSLLGLIDELLNFSRIEAGRMPSMPVDFDLHAVLADVRGILSVQARAKNLRLGVHVSPRTPYRLRGEARQLRDILVNLVGNAVKFTETGGVAMTVDMVGGTAERPRLRFEINDTGIGIAWDARARIFETFTQADETIINTHGGTGLGLAICKQLVEMQGGKIDVDSEVGVGSTFWFELDFEETAGDLAAADMSQLAVVAVGASQERADALVVALAASGVTAVPAVGVREALRVMRATAVRPGSRRAVVVDAEESDVDGEAMVAALRAADDADVTEFVLIDPRLDDGLPDVEMRLMCVSTAPSRPSAERLSAMLRVANVGSVGHLPRREPARQDGEPSAVARRLTILVAEDNRTNQKVIRKVLERAGHEVRIADNGELALDALTERSFDLVLMDVNMPVLDGVECTKLYRFASIGKPRTPIVALTADATSDARIRCAEAGMDACVTKPIEPQRLLAIIDELTGGAGAGSAVADAEALPDDAPANLADEGVDDEIVANIAKHPGFRSARRSVVDRRTLVELEELGGREFVADLVGEFIGEASTVLKALHDAMESGQSGEFREQAHALRSGAANIGARGIYDICLSYRQVDARALAKDGAEHMRRLEAEFDRVRKTLRREFPEKADSPAASNTQR